MIPIRQDRSRAAPRGIIARQSGTGVIAGQRPGGPVAAGRAGRHRARDIVLRSKIASWPEVTPWIRAVAEPCRAGPGDGPRSASDPLQQRKTRPLNTSVRVRFAPSPTGHLHVGGARTALYNYLFARSQGGVFVLRIEDTDAARSTPESLAAIVDSMKWLGLSWDEGPEIGRPFGPYFQSQRRESYGIHAQARVEAGRAYPCFCTAAELEERRKQMAERGEAPKYDGRCRGLDGAARERLAGERRSAAIRFASPDQGETDWDDVVRGRVAFQNQVLDDFVLRRSDGLPTYNFACVVDDHEMQISHVIRGDDHISNTPRQLLLYQALGWQVPRFAHVPMILGSDGSRLSKRHGATSVVAYREMGYLPSALVNFLALLGWSYDGTQELFTLAELERLFRLERVGSNPAVFNLEKLEWMNGQHLKRLPEAERTRRVGEFLAARGHDLSTRSPERLALLVRAIGERMKKLTDAEGHGAFA